MEKLLVVKIGGNIIDDDQKLRAFIGQFAALQHKKILVHGGGKLATRVATAMGVQQQMLDGRRITDTETLKIVTMVYAGYINKNIVALLQEHHSNAIGITGADGSAILAHKRIHPTIDYGMVGDIDEVNQNLFESMLHKDLDIVVAPITHDKKGNLLNSNADTVAQEIAKAMSALYEVQLIYCFEKKGVLADATDEESSLPYLTVDLFKKLKTGGIINQGMIPKLENAFAAIDAGVSTVTIGDALELNQLLSQQSGTLIKK